MDLLSDTISEGLTGAFGGRTCQIRETGANIIFWSKIKSNVPNPYMEGAVVTYRVLTKQRLQFWEDISMGKRFGGRYQAYISSFLLYAYTYGLMNALMEEIPYMDSEGRRERLARKAELDALRRKYIRTEKSRKENEDYLESQSKKQKYFTIFPNVNNPTDIQTAVDLEIIVPS